MVGRGGRVWRVGGVASEGLLRPAHRRLRGGVRDVGGAHGGAISSSGRVWVPYFRPLGHVADPWGWLTSTKQFLQSSCAEEMLTGANRVKIDVVTTDATTVDYPVN